ncbi:putative paraquat-inducible protein A [Anaerotaenia torta]|uniref:DUF6472 family protein n=1 Tax=Anaerotaenia torta TaxID=433293 RepID=UPI003D1F0F72
MDKANHCESCNYYEYDEEYDCYVCRVNLDEDDMERFTSYSVFHCPHFQYKDEYRIVRKQI